MNTATVPNAFQPKPGLKLSTMIIAPPGEDVKGRLQPVEVCGFNSW